MLSRRTTLTYVVTYLTIGGLGFLVFPRLARDLMLSDGDYDDVGFRVAGLMMLALAYLIWNIVRHEEPQPPPSGATRLEEGDLVVPYGPHAAIDRALRILEPRDASESP